MLKEIKIAIVENDEHDALILKNHLLRYFNEKNLKMDLLCFSNGYDFLEKINSFDLVFLDIEMPGINGMDVSKKIRELNSNHPLIIFVTNMAQFAIQGYKVNALDFCLKPVTYQDVFIPLEKAIEILKTDEDKFLTITVKGVSKKININDIIYIEMIKHDVNVIYYENQNEERYSYRGSLKELDSFIENTSLIRANSGSIINVKYFSSYNAKDNVCTLKNGSRITVSRGQKKTFLEGVTK